MATNVLRERLMTVVCVGVAAIVVVMAIHDGYISHVSSALKVAGILAVVLSFAAKPEIFGFRHDTDAEVPRLVRIGMVFFAFTFVIASLVDFAVGLGYAF